MRFETEFRTAVLQIIRCLEFRVGTAGVNVRGVAENLHNLFCIDNHTENPFWGYEIWYPHYTAFALIYQPFSGFLGLIFVNIFQKPSENRAGKLAVSARNSREERY